MITEGVVYKSTGSLYDLADAWRPVAAIGVGYLHESWNNYFEILLVLQPYWLQEVLKSDIKISKLLFQDSWRYPAPIAATGCQALARSYKDPVDL